MKNRNFCQRRLVIILFYSLLVICNFLFLQCHAYPPVPKGAVKIVWVDSLPGDFSFINSWNYPEGVYRNEYGQLSCDGLCPPETDTMKDENGKIYPQDIQAFYRLLDTTHRYFTLKSEARTYEWAGTNYIRVTRKENKVTAETESNAATHSILVLQIAAENCIPEIHINSISETVPEKFICKKGTIKICRSLWNQGILKAEFNFTFEDKQSKTSMCWKGKIHADIEKE